jgi:hypothetical protein
MGRTRHSVTTPLAMWHETGSRRSIGKRTVISRRMTLHLLVHVPLKADLNHQNRSVGE